MTQGYCTQPTILIFKRKSKTFKSKTPLLLDGFQSKEQIPNGEIHMKKPEVDKQPRAFFLFKKHSM